MISYLFFIFFNLFLLFKPPFAICLCLITYQMYKGLYLCASICNNIFNIFYLFSITFTLINQYKPIFLCTPL